MFDLVPVIWTGSLTAMFWDLFIWFSPFWKKQYLSLWDAKLLRKLSNQQTSGPWILLWTVIFMSFFCCFLAKCKVTQRCVSQDRTHSEFYNPVKRRKCNLCAFLHLIYSIPPQFFTFFMSIPFQRWDRETKVYQCFIYMDTCRTMMTNEDRLYGTFL